MADSAVDAKPQSQLVRTKACDWVLENLFHSSTQADGAVFSMAFECLAETFAIMDIAGEGSQLDLVDLVVQQYGASNRAAQGSYSGFTNYVTWLRNGKPEARTEAQICYEAYTHLHLVLKYGSLLGNLLTFKCLLKAKQGLGKLKDEVSRTWGLAFADYLHARTVKKAGQDRESHNKEFVLAADKLLIRALKLMTNKQICPKLDKLKAEGFSRTVCFPKYYIACVLALQDEDDQCLYWLTKAKFQNGLPEISTIEANTDFDVIKARQTDFNVILKEPSAYTKERFTFYRDRRRYLKTQFVAEPSVPGPHKLSASQILSESSLLRDALSKSTLDILTGNGKNGKFEMMVNLKHFLEPVKSKESVAAEARLKERMALYGVEARREIPGDGNCQMYSISHQLTGNINHGAYIRRTLVRWLRTHATCTLPNGATLTDFVCDRKFEDYCASMSNNGTWGDHLTLIAATEVFCCRVVIISSAPGDNYIIEINPALGKEALSLSNSSIMAVPETNLMMLSHLAEFHYGSVHPVEVKDCAF